MTDIIEEVKFRIPTRSELPMNHSSIPSLKRRPKWIIKHWLAEGQLCFFAAESSTFKTFIATHIASMVSLGRDCLGQKVSKGNSLMILSEGGDDNAFRLWGVMKKNDTLITDEMVDMRTLSVDLMKEDHAEALINLIKEEDNNIKILWIDTFAMNTSGKNDSDEDTMAFMKNCRHIMEETGVAIVILDHLPKSSDGKKVYRPKGAGAKFNAQDAGWGAFRANRNTGDRFVELYQTKQRLGRDDLEVELGLEVINLDWDEIEEEHITTLVVTETPGPFIKQSNKPTF